jgi:hypothetical protein
MHSVATSDTSTRRSRIACKVCGRMVDLGRLREHLRSEHQAGSTEVETLYLTARIEARKTQRSRT